MSDVPATPPIDISLPAIPGIVARRTHGPGDWEVLARLLNDAHRADGIEEVNTATSLAADWGARDHFDLARDVYVVEIGGEPVAFGVGCRMIRDDTLALETWGSVTPAWRRRGIGTALHRALRHRLAAESAADPFVGPRAFRGYAMEGEAGAAALFAQERFATIRYGYEMRRPLGGALPVHSLGPGLELRPVREADHRAIFEADDEAFCDHWGHRPATEGDFAAMYANPDLDTSLWQVAWDGDAVAGVVMNYIYADDNTQFGVERGWLERVSVRRAWRGRGVAKALCAASLAALRERGMSEAWLGVDAANPTGAMGLYEGLGFSVARRWFAYGRPIEGETGPR